MSFLLDTDTCVFWLRGRTTVRDHIDRVIEELSAAALAISVVTLAELRYGADYSDRPADNHQAIDGFVSGLTVLTVGQEAASVFGQVKADLRRKGMLIEDLDLLIAATAKAHDLTLVTNNKAHFNRIAGLRLENWLES